MDKIEIGGNALTLWRGKLNAHISNYFKNRGERLIKKGSKQAVTNPSSKFINHCTIIINFTVDGVHKYQIVHQGKFADRYKEWRTAKADNEDAQALEIREMFEIITIERKLWFKKD